MNHRLTIFLSTAIVLTGCAGPSQPATTSPADGPSEPTAATTETPATDPTSTTAGEEDLVARGKALYVEKCAGCHGDAGQGGDQAPPVVGAEALPLDPREGQQRNVQFRTALDVIDWVKVNMPPGDGLPEDEAIAIVAFDLSANGVALPAEGFDRNTAAQIVLHP